MLYYIILYSTITLYYILFIHILYIYTIVLVARELPLPHLQGPGTGHGCNIRLALTY